MYPLLTEELTKDYMNPHNRPRIRPNPTTLGSIITLDEAEGVPLPPDGPDFDRKSVVKRAVRIGLYDTVKKDFIHNTA